MYGTIEGTRGITLKGLLVIFVILAGAAAALYPIFAKMGSEALSANCRNNLRKIGNALELYANDCNEFVPPADWYGPGGTVSWRESLKEFLGTDYPAVFKCAAKPGTDVGYAVNYKTFGRNKKGTKNKNCVKLREINSRDLTIYALDTGRVTEETKHEKPDRWKETGEDAPTYCRCTTSDKYWAEDPIRPMPRHAHKVNCLMLNGVVKSYSVDAIVNPDEGNEACLWDKK